MLALEELSLKIKTTEHSTHTYMGKQSDSLKVMPEEGNSVHAVWAVLRRRKSIYFCNCKCADKFCYGVEKKKTNGWKREDLI